MKLPQCLLFLVVKCCSKLHKERKNNNRWTCQLTIDIYLEDGCGGGGGVRLNRINQSYIPPLTIPARYHLLIINYY